MEVNASTRLSESLFLAIFLQKMLSSLLFYDLELEHVLELLLCPQLTQWTWYGEGLLYRYLVYSHVLLLF